MTGDHGQERDSSGRGSQRIFGRRIASRTDGDDRDRNLIGITIGGRYTNERKWFEGGQQELNGFN
jgi:hypothetical protein